MSQAPQDWLTVDHPASNRPRSKGLSIIPYNTRHTRL